MPKKSTLSLKCRLHRGSVASGANEQVCRILSAGDHAAPQESTPLVRRVAPVESAHLAATPRATTTATPTSGQPSTEWIEKVESIVRDTH